MERVEEESVLDAIYDDAAETLDDADDEDVEMLDAETLAGVPPPAAAASGVHEAATADECTQGRNQRRRANKKKNKKKRKGGPASTSITDINRFVIDTCRRLKERKSYLVWNAVGCLGVAAVSDLVKEDLHGGWEVRRCGCRVAGIVGWSNPCITCVMHRSCIRSNDEKMFIMVDAIQNCGGQKTVDERRFRTGGGILWNILKTREPKAYKEIMAKGREFEKQFKQPKAAQMPRKEGNPHDMNPSGGGGEVMERTEQIISPSDSNTGRISISSRIRVPVAYDDLFEEGEINEST